MILTLISLSPITLKIRASTPVFPVTLFLLSLKDTFSKTILIPDALEFEVLKFHCFMIERIQNSKWNIFSITGIIVLACKIFAQN
jgi:hypothetical protein